MTLEEFIAQVKAGKMMVPMGRMNGTAIEEYLAPLSMTDVGAVTAEAFAHGCFQPMIPWPEAEAKVAAALGTRHQSDLFEV